MGPLKSLSSFSMFFENKTDRPSGSSVIIMSALSPIMTALGMGNYFRQNLLNVMSVRVSFGCQGCRSDFINEVSSVRRQAPVDRRQAQA